MTTKILTYSLGGAIVVVAAVFGARYFLSPPDAQPAEFPGRIEGTTNFPSDFVPEQIVCAQSVEGGEERCATSPAADADATAPKWSIKVPAGSYYISSRVKNPSDLGSDIGERRAYYTQYVLCGLSIECTDHTKIPVVVGSGQAVGEITPYDWYTE